MTDLIPWNNVYHWVRSKISLEAFDTKWVAQVSLLSKRLARGKWSVEGTRFLAIAPQPIDGCPTSRSFFARCGIPPLSPRASYGKQTCSLGDLGFLLIDRLRDEDDPSFIIFARPGFFDFG